MLIRQSESTAALRTLSVVLKQSDGVTPFTGTISAAEFQLRKAGGSLGNATGTATLTDAATGEFLMVLAQADCDTLGQLVIRVVKTGVQSWLERLQVVAFNANDAIRMGMTALRPDAILIGTVTAGTLTTTSFSNNLTIPSGALAGDAHVRFLGNTTAALAGQLQKISAYTAGLITVAAALSVAPAIGDQFVIVN